MVFTGYHIYRSRRPLRIDVSYHDGRETECRSTYSWFASSFWLCGVRRMGGVSVDVVAKSILADEDFEMGGVVLWGRHFPHKCVVGYVTWFVSSNQLLASAPCGLAKFFSLAPTPTPHIKAQHQPNIHGCIPPPSWRPGFYRMRIVSRLVHLVRASSADQCNVESSIILRSSMPWDLLVIAIEGEVPVSTIFIDLQRR